MVGLISLLLSSVMAATPTTPPPWFEQGDYPMTAVERRTEGVTAFELLVDPRGKPVDCSIVQSSASSTLDRQSCVVAMRKARFAPAIGPDGQATYGIYRSKVIWSLDPEKWAQLEAGPDIELNLNKLPNGETAPIDVKFAYLVGTDGTPAGCSAIGPRKLDALVNLGCEQLLAKAPRIPGKLPSDGPVPVVRTVWVRFATTQ